MRKVIFITTILFIFFVFVLQREGSAWNDDVTHKDLSEYAAENSVLSKVKGDYLRNLGFEKGLDAIFKWGANEQKVRNWLREGAQLEDAQDPLFPLFGTTRSFNHFHNPLVQSWTQAGLNDTWTGESSVLWAQDGTYQENFPKGNWSWQKVREYYYAALTGTDFSGAVVAPDELTKKAYFARTFKGLGHQMHLLQDTAVPDHVRNDAHPEDAIFGKLNINIYFESWAKAKNDKINLFAANPVFPNVPFNVSNGFIPITQLYDTDSYNGYNPSAGVNQGLSEYTNANFFSNDTMFAAEIYSPGHSHYFEYPKKTSTDLQGYINGTKPSETFIEEDGQTDTGIWLSKDSDGEHISHFLRTGLSSRLIYTLFGEGDLFYKSFYRDDRCHYDYAEKLIPRAVGYSAGLLDYFFRGNIEITLPSTGIYAKTTNPAVGFTSLKLLAKNITSNGDEMTNGNIQLVVKYKLALEDPFHSIPVTTAPDFSYIVVTENNVHAIPKTSTVELNFDLTQTPIPLYAVDLYLQVVYKGILGNETDAVAVGYKDISEPTPIDIFSNTDYICLYNNWYVAGSPEAIAQVDVNHDGRAYGANEYDVYPHDQKNIYVKVSSISSPQYASPSNYDVKVTYLTRGNLVRPLYILGDDFQSTSYQFTYSFYTTWVRVDTTNDYWTHYITQYLFDFGMTIKNQTEYVEGTEFCGGNPPCRVYPGYDAFYPAFEQFRGVEMWWGGGLRYIVSPYPAGSYCDYGAL